MLNSEKLRDYPNLYNLSLLFATGYSVESAMRTPKNQLQILVRKNAASKLAPAEAEKAMETYNRLFPNSQVNAANPMLQKERNMFMVDLFASRSSQGVVDFTNAVLYNVYLYTHSPECTLTTNSKEALNNFIYTISNSGEMKDQIMSSGQAYLLERTYGTMREVRDINLNLNRMTGTNSLSAAFDKITKIERSSIEDKLDVTTLIGEPVVHYLNALIGGASTSQLIGEQVTPEARPQA